MPTYTTRNNLYKPSPTDAISVAGAGQELATRISDRLDRVRNTSGTKWLHTMAMYEERAASLAGYMVINTSIPFVSGASEDKMLRIDVRGYTYWPYNNIIDCSFNLYMLNGGTPVAPDFNNKGSMTFKEARVLRNNTNNTLSLALLPELPAGNNVWHYPKLVVDGAISWGTEIPDAQFTEFTITRLTALTNYTTVHTILSGGWIPITLESGWVPYDAGGTAGHATPRIRRVGEQVFVEGLVSNGALTGTIFTLPQGFRHTGGPLIFNLYGNGGASRVDVNSSGPVYANGIPGNAYLSLNGLIIPVGNTA